MPGPVALLINVGVIGGHTIGREYGAELSVHGRANMCYFTWPSMLTRWAHQNARVIRHAATDVEKYGIWIIRGVYTAKKIHRHVWTDRNLKINCGFEMGLDNVLKVNPAVEWETTRHTEGEANFSANVCDLSNLPSGLFVSLGG